MLKLNLLPLLEKKDLKWNNLKRLLVFYLARLVLLLVVFVVLLANTLFYMYILVNSQKEMIENRRNNEKMLTLLEKENEIIQNNREIRQIFDKQEEFILWTPVLEELETVIPQGIYLESLSYQSLSGRIRITGWASNRDELIELDNLLKNSLYFTDIESPLSNLIKQTDIYFNFTFKPVLR